MKKNLRSGTEQAFPAKKPSSLPFRSVHNNFLPKLPA